MNLRDLLDGYLRDDVSLPEVDGWLANYPWDRPISRERIVAGRVNMLVAEVSQGLRSEEDFRQVLASEFGAL